MGAFLITCVGIALLIVGGITISVHLHTPSIKGQQEVGAPRFYAAPRRYATEVADVDPMNDGRKYALSQLHLSFFRASVQLDLVGCTVVMQEPGSSRLLTRN